MVTKSEEQVTKEYKDRGYFHVHCGCPDFLFYKTKEGTQNPKVEDIDISSVEFVEVKYNGDVLSHEQQIWRHILQGLGLKYSLIHIPSKSLGVS